MAADGRDWVQAVEYILTECVRMMSLSLDEFRRTYLNAEHYLS
jgi:hypothetical protein